MATTPQALFMTWQGVGTSSVLTHCCNNVPQYSTRSGIADTVKIVNTGH